MAIKSIVATGMNGARAVLVTGGAGYIGSHACKALARVGYLPVAFDSLLYGHSEVVKWGPLVVGDLADQRLLADTMRDFEVVAVMHFAALTYVGESIAKPELYFRNNVVNSLGLLDVMRQVGVHHIVFSSTCATYGLPETVPIAETTPQCPVNPYGESKLMVERALQWYGHAHGLTYAALRYFNAAGADPDGEIGAISMERTTRRRMAPRCATISMFRTSPRRMSRRFLISRKVDQASRLTSALVMASRFAR